MATVRIVSIEDRLAEMDTEIEAMGLTGTLTHEKFRRAAEVFGSSDMAEIREREAAMESDYQRERCLDDYNHAYADAKWADDGGFIPTI